MKTKLKMMSEPEMNDVIRALFSWFESQEIPPYAAFMTINQAAGIMLGWLSGNEKELESGLAAIQKDLKITARNSYKRKKRISAV